jgi:uncharacterized protein with NRDE domain
MCLILFAINHHPKYKFVLAANRDEFFNRPTLFARLWEGDHKIIGGRDVSSNGTWLGISESGKFLAITNYRDPGRENTNAKSRGSLSRDFLLNPQEVKSFVESVSENRNIYNGFNVLLSDNGFRSITHYSNISDTAQNVVSGIHGLSNAFLDTPWQKVERGKQRLDQVLASPEIHLSELIHLLKDQKDAPDALLPATGISFDLEKKLSPVFISMNGYGTRCSTAILVDQNDQLKFLEVSYNESAEVINRTELSLKLKY